jgi:trans-aconitate methyltransferase
MNSVKNHFDRMSSSYRQRSTSGLWKWLRKIETQLVLKALGDGNYTSILEVGSGAGYYTEILRTKFPKAKIVCVDVSADMHLQNKTENCSMVCGDIENFSTEQKFDLILCAGVLEFVANLESALTRLGSLLQRNGRLVALLPKENIWGTQYQNFHKKNDIQIQLFSTQWCKNRKKENLLFVGDFHSFFSFSFVSIWKSQINE